jgi:hypothetical protein
VARRKISKRASDDGDADRHPNPIGEVLCPSWWRRSPSTLASDEDRAALVRETMDPFDGATDGGSDNEIEAGQAPDV